MDQLKKISKYNFIYLFLSLILAGFSTPAYVGFFGYFNLLAFALFWICIKNLNNKKIVVSSFVYFFIVSAIQLSWLSSTRYQGTLIILVYLFVLAWFAICFSLITFMLFKDKNLNISKMNILKMNISKMNILKMLFISSIWVLLEYSKLYFLCGFPFFPIASSFSNNIYALQLASVFGVYGLSFYIIFANLVFFNFYIKKSIKTFSFWIFLFVFPTLFGFIHLKIYEKKVFASEKINCILVQTAILPEEKNLLNGYFDSFVSPLLQWSNIIDLISEYKNKNIDFIVLPEASTAFSAFSNYYPFDLVKKLFMNKFDKYQLSNLPKFKKPFAEEIDGKFYVSNSYFSKALANIYNANFIAGFDDYEEDSTYNAAFFFNPNNYNFLRYEKQKLVPIGEYIPINLLRNFIKNQYNISSSFNRGTISKVFHDKFNFSLSICYDEMYSDVMRNAKIKGSNFFINLTNNAWFYNSKLYYQHFILSRIKAIENGNPLVRACNTGVTAGIDAFGRIVNYILVENEKKAIYTEIPSFNYKTIYSYFGDKLIVCISFSFIFIYFLYNYYLQKKIKLS